MAAVLASFVGGTFAIYARPGAAAPLALAGVIALAHPLAWTEGTVAPAALQVWRARTSRVAIPEDSGLRLWHAEPPSEHRFVHRLLASPLLLFATS